MLGKAGKYGHLPNVTYEIPSDARASPVDDLLVLVSPYHPLEIKLSR